MRRLHSAELDKMRLDEVFEEIKLYRKAMYEKYDLHDTGKIPTKLEREYLLDLSRRLQLLKPERALTVVDGPLGGEYENGSNNSSFAPLKWCKTF